MLLTLKFKIEILEFTSLNFDSTKFKIKIKVYSFKILKLIEITLTEKGMKVFRKEKEYKYKFSELLKRILEKENQKILDILSIENLRNLNFKIKSLDFKLKIGVVENMLTTFLVTILSTIISSIFAFKRGMYNKDKFSYEIYPEFDKFYFDIKLNLKLEIKSNGIYKFMFNNYYLIKDLMKVIKELKQNDKLLNDITTLKKLNESSI